MSTNQSSEQKAPSAGPINFMNLPSATSGNTPTFGQAPFKPPTSAANINPGTQVSSGFNLTPSTQAPTGFNLTLGTQAPTGFSLTPGTQAPTGFSLTPGTQAPTGFSLTPGTQAPTGFSLTPGTQAPTGFSLTPSTQASTPNLGMAATSKPATGVTFSTPKPATSVASQPSTPATTQPAATLGLSTTTPVTSGSSTTGASNLTLGTKTPAPSSSTQPQSLTFQQLEELILNKWTAELCEQEKLFFNQATQINIWDKIINENSEKLTQLHSTMEKVRKQQSKINDDLEVIATHQKDLEACLVPLEKEDLLSVLKGDPNRKNLYSNAKKVDSQIKSMSESLKETIEHINETSRSHDTEDPVIQVGRILNAHMESLRWIDEHTARMQDYFDSLLKMHDDLRRECDMSKH